jgi:hypothetical protein
MKKTLLSILTIAGLGALSANGQTFAPTAMQGLPDGTVGVAYSEDISISDIPATTTVDISALGLPSVVDQFLPLIPGGVPTSFDFTVTSVTFTVSELPSDFSATSSAIAPLGSDVITVSGTPLAASSSVVNVTSLTSGSADLTAVFDAAGTLGGVALAAAGVTNPFPVPAPVPGLFDEEGYTMNVTDPNSIAESNEVFSLGLYPNPTEGISTLDVNSTVAGTATVEVYSITGSLVQTSVKPIRVGANRLSLDFTSVPAGIYLVKADINGHQALVRTQKK